MRIKPASPNGGEIQGTRRKRIALSARFQPQYCAPHQKSATGIVLKFNACADAAFEFHINWNRF
jgi:hypothetical protein